MMPDYPNQTPLVPSKPANQRRIYILAAIVAAIIISFVVFLITNNNTSVVTPPRITEVRAFTIAAAGDIAVAGGDQAKVAGLIGQIKPDYLLALGDIQYPNGKLADYTSKEGYDKSWGAYNAVVKPVPGNHDYRQVCGRDYFAYFDPTNTGKFGSACKAYYSFKDGRWLLLALDSECVVLRGSQNCKKAQEAWAAKEIANNPGLCIAAYWHQPAYTHPGAKEGHGDSAAMQDMFKLLVDHQASIVLNGHNHFYSRSYPINGSGERDDSKGIVQFVSGGGGARLYGGGGLDKRGIEVFNRAGHGVLKIDFSGNSYSYGFMDTNGKVYDSSSGVGYCAG